MTSSRSLGKGDEGFSLIEMIVAIGVASIILAAVSAFLVNSWRAQKTVESVSSATNHGQIIGSMIERAVRNAENLTVTGDELKVWTSLDGSALKCQGFRIASGTVQVMTSSGTLPASWPQWSPSLAVAGASPYFTRSTSDVVSYSFDIDTDGATVRISGESQPRSELRSGNGSCW
jgi:prepilin-type N-terminal cleavage/methylation domain-containing protein